MLVQTRRFFYRDAPAASLTGVFPRQTSRPTSKDNDGNTRNKKKRAAGDLRISAALFLEPYQPFFKGK